MNTLKQIWAAYYELCVAYAWWAMWHSESRAESILGFVSLFITPFLVAMFFIIGPCDLVRMEARLAAWIVGAF